MNVVVALSLSLSLFLVYSTLHFFLLVYCFPLYSLSRLDPLSLSLSHLLP